MTLFAEVSGARIVMGAIVVPEVGTWSADLTLEKEVELAGAVNVKLAGLELAGVVYRAGTYAGRTMARIAGGKARGWWNLIAPKGYSNPAGVKLSLVLGDAAREIGEAVRVESDRVLGPHFARMGDPALGGKLPACRLLNLLASSWWVEPSGSAVVGTRASSPIASAFELVSLDRAKGLAVIATESPADFTPGRTFTSTRAPGRTFTISATTIKLAGSSLRAEVMFR